MGNSFRKMFDRLFGNREMRVVMLGLDAAGKTTILYKLHIGEILSTVPTIGESFFLHLREWLCLPLSPYKFIIFYGLSSSSRSSCLKSYIGHSFAVLTHIAAIKQAIDFLANVATNIICKLKHLPEL